MKLDNFLEILCLLKICSQPNPILLNDFFRKVINKAFNEMNNFIVGNVCNFKALNIRLICILKFHPAKVKLSFQKLKPKHIPKQALILRNGTFVKYQIQRKNTFEIQCYVVNITSIFLHKWLLRKIKRKYLRLKSFNPVDLLEYRGSLKLKTYIIFICIVCC